jgi:hypothetical protein
LELIAQPESSAPQKEIEIFRLGGAMTSFPFHEKDENLSILPCQKQIEEMLSGYYRDAVEYLTSDTQIYPHQTLWHKSIFQLLKVTNQSF